MNDKQVSHAKPDDHLVCGDCVHCMPGPNTKEDIFSRCCYRMPPVPMLAQTSEGVGLVSVRPAIRTDTWACGEYETEEDDDPPLTDVPEHPQNPRITGFQK